MQAESISPRALAGECPSCRATAPLFLEVEVVHSYWYHVNDPTKPCLLYVECACGACFFVDLPRGVYGPFAVLVMR